MSRVHVRFRGRRIANGQAVYAVESLDFRDCQLVGEIRIDLVTYEYEFVPTGPLKGKRLIPPQVFDLPIDEQARVIERDYPFSEFGGLTLRVARMVQQLRDRRELPEEFYGVT